MTTLEAKVAELRARFGRETQTPVRCVELDESDFDEEGALRVEAQRLLPLDAYSERFEELLQLGYSWINVSWLGPYGGWQVVGIELPEASVGAAETSVNLSGPTSSNVTIVEAD